MNARIGIWVVTWGLSLAATAVTQAQVAGNAAAGWSTWRGPNHMGVVEACPLPGQWPAELPQPGWTAELGTGWSSPVVDSRRVVVTDRVGMTERTLAFDRKTGDLLWSQSHPVDFDPHPVGARHGNGPKATATIAGGRVYSVGISGWLECLDAETGERLWSVNYPERFGRREPLPGGRAHVVGEQHVIVPVGNGQGAPVPLFGYTGSPLVKQGLVVCPVGGERAGTIVAFDAESGRVVWQALKENVSYSSPVVAELAGVRQVVVMTGPRVVGLDLASGQLLWSHPFQIQYDESISTPVVSGDLVLVTGDNRPLTALRITREGDAIRKEVAWENRDLTSYLSSMVVRDGHVYGQNDGGEVVCIRLADGKTVWYGGSNGFYSTAVRCGEQMLLLNERGRLLVVRAAADRYEPLVQWPLAGEACWTSPAVAEDGIYVRSDGKLRWIPLR